MKCLLIYFTKIIPLTYKYPEINFEDEETDKNYETQSVLDLPQDFIHSLKNNCFCDFYTPFKLWYVVLLLMENMKGDLKEHFIEYIKYI